MVFGELKKRFLKWLLDGFNELYKECEDELEEAEEARAREEAKWKPPARYCIRAGGSDIWCDDYRAGPGGFSIEVIWTQSIDGEERPVLCTIYDASYIIIDYETGVTLEQFEKTKQAVKDSMNIAPRTAGGDATHNGSYA